MKVFKIGCLSLTGLAALIIVIAVATSHGSTPPPAAASSPATQAAQTAQATAAVTASAPAPVPAGTQPAGTAPEQEALTAAENYLSLGSGFSRQGLIDQLDSPYGNKFSVADAAWGADHAGADWNAQAVECAKAYMNLGEGFSRQGLIDQLTSAYGNKFTQAQAEYAANAVGL